MPYLPLHIVGTTFNGLKSAISSSHTGRMIHGTLYGYADCFRRWGQRSPVPASVYRLHRKLKKSGPYALQEIVAELPPILQSVGMTVAATLPSANS